MQGVLAPMHGGTVFFGAPWLFLPDTIVVVEDEKSVEISSQFSTF